MTLTNKVLTAALRVPSERIMLMVLFALTASLLLLSYLTLVSPGAMAETIWLNDVFALIDASYRTFRGQIPSIEFSSLYGAAAYYPTALGFHLGFDMGGVLGFGHLITAALLLTLAVLASYRRIPILHSAVLLLFLSLLIVVPMRLGGRFVELTYGIYYTRHGWAALTIVLLFYLDPRTTTRGGLALDAAVLSTLLIYLFYLKITFGAVALAFAIANSITSRYKLWLSVCALSIFLGFVGAIQVFTEYNSAYFDGIFGTVSRNPGLQRGSSGLLIMIVDHLGVFLLCFAALMAAYRTGHRSLFDLAFLVGAIISCLFLLDKSGGTLRGLPTLIMVFIVFGELARRAECRLEAEAASPSWPRNLGAICILGMMLAFLAKPSAERVLAWRLHYKATTGEQSKSAPSLAGIYIYSPFQRADLHEDSHEMLRDDDEAHALFSEMRGSNPLTAPQYLPLVIEGVSLIKTVPHEDRSVITFAQSNPFSAALRLKPTTYGYPIFFAQDANPDSLPDPERFIADADLVMVPVVPHNPRQLEVLMAAYGTYLQENFRESTRSSHWRLFERR
jgi:hypothetical protein